MVFLWFILIQGEPERRATLKSALGNLVPMKRFGGGQCAFCVKADYKNGDEAHFGYVT